MSNSLFNIEILMGMSRNLREENDEWRREVFREGRERAIRGNELLGLFEQEYANLDQELRRLEQYLPRQAESKIEPMSPMPKVAKS